MDDEDFELAFALYDRPGPNSSFANHASSNTSFSNQKPSYDVSHSNQRSVDIFTSSDKRQHDLQSNFSSTTPSNASIFRSSFSPTSKSPNSSNKHAIHANPITLSTSSEKTTSMFSGASSPFKLPSKAHHRFNNDKVIQFNSPTSKASSISKNSVYGSSAFPEDDIEDSAIKSSNFAASSSVPSPHSSNSNQPNSNRNFNSSKLDFTSSRSSNTSKPSNSTIETFFNKSTSSKPSSSLSSNNSSSHGIKSDQYTSLNAIKMSEDPCVSSEVDNLALLDCNSKPHFIDEEAIKTWRYPSNYEKRDYQFAIVKTALHHNTLVCLPTGLGKTLIAAVVIYNFYRWFPESKIIFMAPTKPLVAQQIEACCDIVSIPQEDCISMTGQMQAETRSKHWTSKRIFFVTPQIPKHDIESGICPVDKISLLVFDEAHKAHGDYAFCDVIRGVNKSTPHFRVLALTATPGSDVKSIQEVITNLMISKIELRTEESIDVRPYVHTRFIEEVPVKLEGPVIDVRDKFKAIINSPITWLQSNGALYRLKKDEFFTFNRLEQARASWRNDPNHQRRDEFWKRSVESRYATALAMFYGSRLITDYGVVPFREWMIQQTQKPLLEKTSNYFNELVSSREWTSLSRYLDEAYNKDPDSLRHPKLKKLKEIVTEHFLSRSYETFISSKDQSGSNSTDLKVNGQIGMNNRFNHQQNHQNHQNQSLFDHHSNLHQQNQFNIDSIDPSLQSNAQNDKTRVMIFVHFRDTVEEIVNLLKEQQPLIRPMAFVGQSKKGLSQKQQAEVVKQFREGHYNTLVSTSIGEEGLDIGEVDLIVCYDSQQSPIRMIQRMGRTGRKRNGRCVMLLTVGSEDASYKRSKVKGKAMIRSISGETKFHFYNAPNTLLPPNTRPQIEMHYMTKPVAMNNVDETVEKSKTKKAKRTATKEKNETPKTKNKRKKKGQKNDDDDIFGIFQEKETSNENPIDEEEAELDAIIGNHSIITNHNISTSKFTSIQSINTNLDARKAIIEDENQVEQDFYESSNFVFEKSNSNSPRNDDHEIHVIEEDSLQIIEENDMKMVNDEFLTISENSFIGSKVVSPLAHHVSKPIETSSELKRIPDSLPASPEPVEKPSNNESKLNNLTSSTPPYITETSTKETSILDRSLTNNNLGSVVDNLVILPLEYPEKFFEDQFDDLLVDPKLQNLIPEPPSLINIDAELGFEQKSQTTNLQEQKSKNDQISNQNDQIRNQNDQISNQNEASKLKESHFESPKLNESSKLKETQFESPKSKESHFESSKLNDTQNDPLKSIFTTSDFESPKKDLQNPPLNISTVNSSYFESPKADIEDRQYKRLKKRARVDESFSEFDDEVCQDLNSPLHLNADHSVHGPSPPKYKKTLKKSKFFDEEAELSDNSDVIELNSQDEQSSVDDVPNSQDLAFIAPEDDIHGSQLSSSSQSSVNMRAIYANSLLSSPPNKNLKFSTPEKDKKYISKMKWSKGALERHERWARGEYEDDEVLEMSESDLQSSQEESIQTAYSSPISIGLSPIEKSKPTRPDNINQITTTARMSQINQTSFSKNNFNKNPQSPSRSILSKQPHQHNIPNDNNNLMSSNLDPRTFNNNGGINNNNSNNSNNNNIKPAIVSPFERSKYSSRQPVSLGTPPNPLMNRPISSAPRVALGKSPQIALGTTKPSSPVLPQFNSNSNTNANAFKSSITNQPISTFSSAIDDDDLMEIDVDAILMSRRQ